MSGKKFIGFDIENCDENTFQKNELLLSGNEVTAFKIKGSNKNIFTDNKILMTDQIELIAKLKQDLSLFRNNSNDLNIRLDDLLCKIENLENSDKSNLTEKAQNISQTILNVIELFSEKIPNLAIKLSPYLLSITQLF